MSTTSPEDLTRYREGLRMAHPPTPEQLEAERKLLGDLEGESWGRRNLGFLKLSGPGYLQSAMTLGGGSATASLFAGALFGYKLLWVAPVAMLLGVVMLTAVSHQTLSTGMRPFEAMRRHAGAPLAWGWAIGALLSSIIWHFPQYNLASGVLADMGDVVGWTLDPRILSFVILAWAIGLSLLYGSTPRLVRLYERILKYLVWGIVLSFAFVVARTGVDWDELWRGFFTFQIPEDRNGVSALTLVVSGLAAAVGVNMLFLYPYSLLARGWGREHRRVARFDLLTGMFLPYALATSLMVIATANTMSTEFIDKSLEPLSAAQGLAKEVGPQVGRLLFGAGVLAMALSTITLHMLACGFVAVELFGVRVGGLGYRLATFLPIPGVLGPFLWEDLKFWLAVPTNILCGLFLPAAYVGFIILQGSRRYLGDDRPRGAGAVVWLGGMVVSTVVMTTFLVWAAVTKGPKYYSDLFGG